MSFDKIEIKTIKDVPEDEYYVRGHRTCAGCGPALAARYLLKAAGGRAICITATGCMYVANSSYNTGPWAIPWMHTQLGGVGSAVTGAAAAYKALMRKGKLKKEIIHVIGFAGDGGTADIGLGPLSGAFTTNYDFLVVLYDNESYANTGVQASSLTPWGAWTTFTPPGKMLRVGNVREKKNLAKMIAAGHPGVPYIATACVSYPMDFMTKVRKALAIRGPTLIHVLCPCPKGWKFPPEKTIEVGKLAVETGTWILYEIEGGQFRLTYKPPKRRPVRDYLALQGRFAHLREPDIRFIQEMVDRACREVGIE
ncbi:MAG: pyruvate ferredoxin oxidoreductase [Candidatus Methanomethylicota archaeon]|uniref:Pyruvate ferredoxin oxidoreductase n=1 Tax=Thermoproteota archaeon TaxID=2056631 RepID=A0A497F305_9CREN|nr:MAG: pyruvate ferredoxin oxidoreductase [Candidatus Verstraetearchaeota archaeon]